MIYHVDLEARTTISVTVEAANAVAAMEKAEEIADGERHTVEDGAWRAVDWFAGE